RSELLAFQQLLQALGALVTQDTFFVLEIAVHSLFLHLQNLLRALIQLSTLAREHFAIHNRALNAGRAVKRGVFNIAGFFTEDGAQQFFFRSELRFALWRHFADQNVTRLYGRANANNAALIEVTQERFGDIWNISSDF